VADMWWVFDLEYGTIDLWGCGGFYAMFVIVT
jgi:hypothetical protein